jgi:hypothetical protein
MKSKRENDNRNEMQDNKRNDNNRTLLTGT